MNRRAVPAVALIVLPLAAQAQETPDNLQLHGFAALNPIATTANNFFGNTQNSVSLEFWELGMNASWRATTQLLLSAQLTSRRAGAEDDGAPRLDYGLLSYDILNDEATRVGLRLGRVLNPLGLYNETRDVAFTRSSILLPQSIYFDRTRDVALSSDGFQIFGHRATDLGEFFLQFNAGFPRTDDSGRSKRAVLGTNALGELDPKLSLLGRILYEKEGGRLRLAASGGAVRLNYAANEPTDPIPDGDFDFLPIFFSAQYNAENFTLTSEFGPRIIQTSGLGSPDTTTTGESFYVEALYRFSPIGDGYIRFDSLITDRDDREGKEFARRDPLRRPSYSRFAKDLTAGLTVRLNRSTLIRVEYHYVDGTAWLPLADNAVEDELARYWSIFALQLAFRF